MVYRWPFSPLTLCCLTVLNYTMCMFWCVYVLDSSSDEWTQHGFPGTFQSFVPAPWWIPPGLRRTCILPSRHIAPWCCCPGSHPWCNEPSVPPCKYQWILTHSWHTNAVDVFHVSTVFFFFLPVHDDPMRDVHTFYVFLVVLRVSEKIQAVSWPVILYLGQIKNCCILICHNLRWFKINIHLYHQHQ